MATQRRPYFKIAATAKAAGIPHSLWTVSGHPGAGATPATTPGAVPVRTTTGAMHIENPDTGFVSILDRLALAAAIEGTVLVLYDRLVHVAGLSGTSVVAQTVNSTAITRPDALGEDVEIWLEWYSATGATPRTVSASYTNEAGTAGRTTPSIDFPVSPVAGQMLRLPLQDGDLGCRSVQTVTLSGSTGTAGNFGVTLLRTVSMLTVEDLAQGKVEIPANACLAAYVIPTDTDTGIVTAHVALRRGPA